MSNSLYQNQLYTLAIDLPGLSQSVRFVTALAPYYSAVQAVRGDVGEFAKRMPSADIAAHIYRASLECQFILKLAQARAIGLRLNDPLMPQDISVNYPAKPTYPMSQYTRFKAGTEIMKRLILEFTSGDAKKERKRLGDFEVESSLALQILPFRDLLGELKTQTDRWEAYLLAGPSASIRSAIRAGQKAPYPVPGRLFK